MSVTDAGGLAVSFFALGIAIYGIFERQRAVYAAVRVRITELLDDVEGLNVDEDKYLERAWGQDGDQEAKASSGFARYSLIGRRALLTYQALALIHRLTRSRLPRELQAGSEGDPATAVRAGRAILDRATQVAQRAAWALESQMALRRRATRTVYVNGQYAEEVVGYEDEGASAPGSQGRATTTAAPPQRDAP